MNNGSRTVYMGLEIIIILWEDSFYSLFAIGNPLPIKREWRLFVWLHHWAYWRTHSVDININFGMAHHIQYTIEGYRNNLIGYSISKSPFIGYNISKKHSKSKVIRLIIYIIFLKSSFTEKLGFHQKNISKLCWVICDIFLVKKQIQIPFYVMRFE